MQPKAGAAVLARWIGKGALGSFLFETFWGIPPAKGLKGPKRTDKTAEVTVQTDNVGWILARYLLIQTLFIRCEASYTGGLVDEIFFWGGTASWISSSTESLPACSDIYLYQTQSPWPQVAAAALHCRLQRAVNTKHADIETRQLVHASGTYKYIHAFSPPSSTRLKHCDMAVRQAWVADSRLTTNHTALPLPLPPHTITNHHCLFPAHHMNKPCPNGSSSTSFFVISLLRIW